MKKINLALLILRIILLAIFLYLVWLWVEYYFKNNYESIYNEVIVYDPYKVITCINGVIDFLLYHWVEPRISRYTGRRIYATSPVFFSTTATLYLTRSIINDIDLHNPIMPTQDTVFYSVIGIITIIVYVLLAKDNTRWKR